MSGLYSHHDLPLDRGRAQPIHGLWRSVPLRPRIILGEGKEFLDNFISRDPEGTVYRKRTPIRPNK